MENKKLAKKCNIYREYGKWRNFIYYSRGKDPFYTFYQRPLYTSDVSKERGFLGPVTNHTFIS